MKPLQFVVYRRNGVNHWPLSSRTGLGSMNGDSIQSFDGNYAGTNGGLQGAAMQACEFAEQTGNPIEDGEILIVRNTMQTTGGMRMVRVTVVDSPKYIIEDA